MQTNSPKAEQARVSLQQGDPERALKLLQEAVRTQASDAKLRVFLFQLLAVLGEWERALAQLNLASDLDASALAMAQVYREALKCEVLREQVFAGAKAPMVLGEPEQWLALLIESLLRSGRGDEVQADALRTEAFDAAPSRPGVIDSNTFDWCADADMRLGPVCEAIVNGRYYWLPFAHLAKITIEPPSDLRDYVWMPAHFWFANGGDTPGLIPTRYPGSERGDGLTRLARTTTWDEPRTGVYFGSGQRVWTTNQGEYALMDVRELTLAA